MSVILKCCHCGSTSDPPSSPSDSPSSPSSPSPSGSPSGSSPSASASSSSLSVSASSDSRFFDFCTCDCCLWPNTFILEISDASFINDYGFNGTQPAILSFPTRYTMERVTNGGLTWASRELIYDVADDISDGGFDFPTNIFGLDTNGGLAAGRSTAGSRFIDQTTNDDPRPANRQAFVRFAPQDTTGGCNFTFTTFGVGQQLLFSRSLCFLGGTTNPNTLLPLQPGPHSWTCMGGAVFGSFLPKILSTNPYRSTCRLGAAWWEPFGVNTETPSATLTPA